MTPKTLSRLLRVRQLHESLAEAELQQAAATLGHVERTLYMHQHAQKTHEQASRHALANNERRTAFMYETQIEAESASIHSLKRVEKQLRSSLDESRERYFDRHLEKRQIQTLLAKRQTADDLTASRKEERDLGDWFLLRFF